MITEKLKGGNHEVLKKGFKQFMALFTVAVLLVSSVPCSVNAQEARQRVYTREGYEIIYSVSSRWSGNQNINITVSNTGEQDICGWAVSFVPGGKIYNIWDARVIACGDGEDTTAEYLIRSENYNGRIPAGGSISFGYQVATDSEECPADIKLCAERVILPEEVYTVSLNIQGDWQTGLRERLCCRIQERMIFISGSLRLIPISVSTACGTHGCQKIRLRVVPIL